MTKDRIMKRFVCPKCGAESLIDVHAFAEIYPCSDLECDEYAVAIEIEDPHA